MLVQIFYFVGWLFITSLLLIFTLIVLAYCVSVFTDIWLFSKYKRQVLLRAIKIADTQMKKEKGEVK